MTIGKVHRIDVRVDTALLRMIKKLQRKMKVSRSEVVRQLIEAKLLELGGDYVIKRNLQKVQGPGPVSRA